MITMNRGLGRAGNPGAGGALAIDPVALNAVDPVVIDGRMAGSSSDRSGLIVPTPATIVDSSVGSSSPSSTATQSTSVSVAPVSTDWSSLLTETLFLVPNWVWIAGIGAFFLMGGKRR